MGTAATGNASLQDDASADKEADDTEKSEEAGAAGEFRWTCSQHCTMKPSLMITSGRYSEVPKLLPDMDARLANMF